MNLQPSFEIAARARKVDDQVVIDLSDLTHLPSADLSVFVQTLQRVQKSGVNLVLGGLQDQRSSPI